MTKNYKGIFHGVLPLLHVGKVRETYEVPNRPDLLLVLATDRVSTHNVVHKSLVPEKGVVLTAFTVHWLRDVFSDIRNHLVASGREIYQYLPNFIGPDFDDLHHRALIVRKLEMIPVEFIHRRYLVGAGSLYRAYNAGEDPYGLDLPSGLPVMHRFDPPIFTPTDKSDSDDPLNTDDVINDHTNASLRSSEVFTRGEEWLAARGIAGLDSKFELGNRSILADEVWTPDSSRFALLEEVDSAVDEERDPAWMDKQIVRDYAEAKWGANAKCPLVLPSAIVEETSTCYDDILLRLSNHNTQEWVRGECFDFHI